MYERILFVRCAAKVTTMTGLSFQGFIFLTFCPDQQFDQVVCSFVSGNVHFKTVKKAISTSNRVVLVVCTLCKYLNIFLMVCADVFILLVCVDTS